MKTIPQNYRIEVEWYPVPNEWPQEVINSESYVDHVLECTGAEFEHFDRLDKALRFAKKLYDNRKCFFGDIQLTLLEATRRTYTDFDEDAYSVTDWEFISDWHYSGGNPYEEVPDVVMEICGKTK